MLRILLSLVFGIVLSASAAASAPRPNIIFVLTDDLGWGDLGVLYQNSRNFDQNRNLPAFVTPALDSMAAQGLRMERHYCPAPVCAPSRASLLLGVHQGHSNVRDNQFDKELADNHTLGTVLKQAGYATAAIGKWGVGGGSGFPGHPQNRGFDYFFGYIPHGDAHYHYPKEQGRRFYENFTDIAADLDKCYSTDLIAARSKRWIDDHRSAHPDQPFFLYLCFTAPHAQLNVPTGPYPAGGGLDGGVQWLGAPGGMINTASGDIDSWIHPDYANATWDHDNNPGTAEQAWPAYARRHATMVRRIDDAMGDLIDLLSDLGIDDETLIVFTSDNGPHNEAGANGSFTQDPRFFRSYGPLDGIKRDVWEGGIRVPTLARWPGGIPAGRVSTHPSQFHDWMGTFAELAGVAAPLRSDGVSLVPNLTGAPGQRDGVVYVEYYTNGSTPTYGDFDTSHRGATRNQMQAIFHQGYKAVRYNAGSAGTPFRVYEVGSDPQETQNLAGQAGVPTQAEIEARVARVRRAGGGVSRPYDAVPVPAEIPIAEAPTNLLRTDFSGRVLAGTTASGFAWTSDFGEEGNATTSLTFTGSASGFIAGYGLESGALNPPGQPIPVAGNVETVGPWSTSFQFTPLVDHELATVDVASYSISGTGAHQLNPKSVGWQVRILGGTVDATASAEGIEPGGNGALTLSCGFTGVELAAGTSYAITLTASSPAPTNGNNLALHSIALITAGNGPEVPEDMVPGLRYAAYEGEFPWVPDFVDETPAADGVSAAPDVSVRTRDDGIGLAFEGYLNVPAAGSYTFYLSTDTGAFVRLHDLQLIDADFAYPGGAERSSGAIPLGAGLHPVSIHYRHADAASHSLTLEWQGPGIPRQAIPAEAFFCEAAAVPGPPAANPDASETTGGSPVTISVLANDLDDGTPQPLFIESVGLPGHGSAAISGDEILYTPRPGFLGTDRFSYTISDGLETATTEVTVEVLPATSTLWLLLDETAGYVVHDALGRPVGVLDGFAESDWTVGTWGGGLRFHGDGDADQVELIGMKGIAGTAARTITFWLNADSDQGAGVRPTLVSWGAGNAGTTGGRFDINLNQTAGYRLRAEFNSSGVNFETPARSDLRGAGWVHCAVVVPEGATASGVLAYLDGIPATAVIEPDGSGNVVIETIPANDIHLGNWATDLTRPFRGVLDDIRIYPRELSPDEIAGLFAQTSDQAYAAAWHFRYSGDSMPGEVEWAADDDADGLGCWLEFALGGNPTVWSPGIMPELSDGPVFRFNRRVVGIDPAAYTVEFSELLAEGSWWALAPGTTEPNPDLPGFDVISVSPPAGTRGFLRLRVSGP